MVHISVLPCPERKAIALQIWDGPTLLGSIDLTSGLLQDMLANLLGAWRSMDKSVGAPGEVATWTNPPAVERPAWAVGARALDGAVTLSLCPAKLGEQELWLTYAFQRAQAEKLHEIWKIALERPTFEGTA